ncbi:MULTISPECIES: efflux RND transporter permease subunit [unclassified Lentimonas]|uniref:efflux RND transporter permease subunit n=1 Tax=unclassified Lentimonas TaxID=2630993 RepID=UPI00132B11A0|nr:MULTISPECIES: efflux RND transporter permease subunit [unclassified Lentimonas]CAA6677242.1 Acriflavin resistance protein [Lentimonas sp. CC4]CAA6686133.1 Acriflavin resistance protein [Lentimonas sp. CC6]CAA7074165.1 Acriflavin resistance protein [Lentimonas sp. CC4]CAA7171523.1 Acriflavin resistance protein [Lentimonas sp. CC21]CAA7182001.1 Acriflavin resistance protein [Lentimonas sp. CC8]
MNTEKSSTSSFHRQKGSIAWMAGHSVTANLLMLVLVVGGLIIGMQTTKEMFPASDPDVISISVSYPGASPEEVEEGIVLPIEEAIQTLDGIEEVVSNAREGSGSVSAEVAAGEDIQQLYADIKNEIDRIRTFPDEAEEPKVRIASYKRDVLDLVIYGSHDEWTLRDAAEVIRDRILQSKEITQVELVGVRDYEVTIEVDRQTLRQYGLTLSQVAARVRNAAVDLPGGGVKTSGGEILVRVTEKRDWASEFESIPIITNSDGSRVYLGDIATVIDGFEESDRYARYGRFVEGAGGETTIDIQNALKIDVFRVGDQTPGKVSAAVEEALEELNETLPATIHAEIMNNKADMFQDRANLLMRNAGYGLVLVLCVLGLFLEARLAFWVMLGIPISFLGAFWIMPLFGASINMISMFAFLITLGIVVDDAIVVGENIYSWHQKGLPFHEAAIAGTKEVAMPVTFSVLTNIVAFMPLMFVPGMMGKFFVAIPIVVISVFAISLIESLYILPAHLSHQKDIHPSGIGGRLHAFQQRFSRWFTGMVNNKYGPFIGRLLNARYLVVAVGIAVLLITLGYVQSGRIRVIQIERPDSDYAYASARLPIGSPIADTEVVALRMAKAAQKTVAENGGLKQAEGVFVNMGNGGSHNFDMRVYLTAPEIRPVDTASFTSKWRQALGPVAGVDTLNFQADRGGPGGGRKGLTLQLSHRDVDTLDAASLALADRLRLFSQIKDIDDGVQPGKQQFDFTVKPAAQALGLDARSIALQIRHSFYGAEALRQLRGRNEVKTMVRLPVEERASIYDIENLVLMTPQGGEIPILDAVEVKRGRAFTGIERNNGRRVIEVSAETEDSGDVGPIMTDLSATVMPQLMQEFPGLTWKFEGRQADMAESMSSLIMGLLMALFCIFALLAIPFNNYYQPLVIMCCIPFGLVGAVFGHIIMGYNLSLMSLFGIVALSGVVVNDSLVLIDFANRRQREEGKSPSEAVQLAGVARFRAIILTTLTTFGGLAPMILETSRQARFMIPMAISLGFGILFATIVVLILVPCFYVILEDIMDLFRSEPRKRLADDSAHITEL